MKKFLWKLAAAAVATACLLCIFTMSFIQNVQAQLWQQSIDTIIESTRQGCHALRIQLQEDFHSLGMMVNYMTVFSSDQTEDIEKLLSSYRQTEDNIYLYVPGRTCIPAGNQIDDTTKYTLNHMPGSSGLVDPHISSVSGLNMFDIFVEVPLSDGVSGYFVKEYEVEAIADKFSLSFYNDAGFSYIVNRRGDVLIRSTHPNSNKTVQNLFDILPLSDNDPTAVSQFRSALLEDQTGWARFSHDGQSMVFCYTPLGLQSDWFLISVIPVDAVEAETNSILAQALMLVGGVILGISLLMFLYLWQSRRSNRKFLNQAHYINHLYNSIPEGIALLTTDQPYRFIQLNREGLRLFNYPDDASNDAPKGRCLKDLIHPEDWTRVKQFLQDTIYSGEKCSITNRIQKADGSYFWSAVLAERTLDENGAPALIATFHDVTDEKLAEEEIKREKLLERRALLSAISNAYSVIISINLTKDEISFQYIEPGLMINLKEKQSYTKLFESIAPTVHTDSITEYRRRFSLQNLKESLGREKNEVFLEYKGMLTDRQYHWLSVQIIHVDNPYSEDHMAILLSRRIDEQKQEDEQHRQALEKALASANAANSAKSRFLSNMSHDIRTPMNAIIGMTSIALDHLDDSGRVEACLKKINLSSAHLLSLINDVLDMSKIESGKLTLSEEPFNFAELISTVAELVRPLAGDNHINLQFYLAPLSCEEVVADPLRIRQVYLNVLSNAVKYTPSGGSVVVEVSQLPDARQGFGRYRFVCTDTGIGMSASFLNTLFKPFTRAHDSTVSKIAGTGLGMAITKNIVDLMGGDIQVESALEKGSTFTITFSLRLQETVRDLFPEQWRGCRALLSSDGTQSGENTAALLNQLGMQTDVVTGQEETVRLLRQQVATYRIVLLLWEGPDMNRLPILKRIRKAVGPDLPVIVLTTYDWDEIERQAKEAGATEFLSLPLYRSKLCELLYKLDGKPSALALTDDRTPDDFRTKRILLTEDNELNREIAVELISSTMDVQIDTACDGKEAFEKIKNTPAGYYDLILMDIQMPKMNGYEATKAIRSLDRPDVQSLPIIAITANAFAEDVQEALQAGMNGHLPKPIEPDALRRTLRKALEGNVSSNQKQQADR